MRGRILAGALVLAIVGISGCGDDDAPVAGDAPGTTTSTVAPAGGDLGAPAGADVDVCALIDRDDVLSIVTAASTDADPSDMTVEDRRPPALRACAFYVENPGVGGTTVNVFIRDGWSFDRDRQDDELDIEELTGLGDEAFTYQGMVGRVIHVRSGATYLEVVTGSYDGRMGITEESLSELVELLLARL